MRIKSVKAPKIDTATHQDTPTEKSTPRLVRLIPISSAASPILSEYMLPTPRQKLKFVRFSLMNPVYTIRFIPIYNPEPMIIPSAL
jgi:hypothetical protein